MDKQAGLSNPAVFDLIIIFCACIIVFGIAGKYDILERIVEFCHQYEDYELDEFITVALFLVMALLVFTFRRFAEIKMINQKLDERSVKLKQAFDTVKKLEEMLPICSACKKIRDDAGDWHSVESYITRKTDTNFTHSICPECTKKLYGNEDWYKDDQ